MSIHLRTTTRVKSTRDDKSIEADLSVMASSISMKLNEFRITASKCAAAKNTARYVENMCSREGAEHDPRLQAIVDKLKASQPTYNLHDIHVGLEGVLEDYSKKVSTYAQTMVTTVQKYSVGLFDLFFRKLSVNKKIDTSKFVGIDASMRMVVMTYGDFREIGDPIIELTNVINKEGGDWLSSLGRVRKALKSNDSEAIKRVLGELTTKIHSGTMATYLKNNKLVEFQFGIDNNNSGSEGLVRITPSDRFKELETSQVLAESGWSDVNKLKDCVLLKKAEPICKQISGLYRVSTDLIDEMRRISCDYCVKDPYTCAALVKYGTLAAQMINCYTKAFDMCWTTCLRVSQACLIESN